MALRGVGADFREHVRRGAVRALDAFPGALRAEIYVVSFRLWHEDQDPRFPYVAVGWNTESEVRRVREQVRGASYEGTARWEYAYWLLEGFPRIGHVPEDPVGSALHGAESRAAGLWYGDEDDLAEDVIDERDDELIRRFDDVCLDAARALHTGGHLVRVLGRPVPVVVFDMDRPGWEVEATSAVNPPEVIAGFLDHHAPGGGAGA